MFFFEKAMVFLKKAMLFFAGSIPFFFPEGARAVSRGGGEGCVACRTGFSVSALRPNFRRRNAEFLLVAPAEIGDAHAHEGGGLGYGVSGLEQPAGAQETAVADVFVGRHARGRPPASR